MKSRGVKLNNVSGIVENGLCSSCGVCAGNCPKQCIKLNVDGGMVKPYIDSTCIECGRCMKVCPVNALSDYDADIIPLDDYILGEYRGIFGACNKNEKWLVECASGGVVTGIIKKLLDENIYDSAFLVCGYDYKYPLFTSRIDATQSLVGTTRSRYVTVSHENAVRYILKHNNERVIVVGTGCAIQGILNFIDMHSKLLRANYFLIGLFCEGTMNYNVIRYFSQHKLSHGRDIKEFYFKHKDVGGWPGGVRIVYDDGTKSDLPDSDRVRIKKYFLEEKCLYCLDKLNRNADISVGDNYIKKNATEKGVSSVIIRTQLGNRIWNKCRDSFHVWEDCVDDLLESQKISLKKENFEFAQIKGLYGDRKNYSKDSLKRYRDNLRKIQVGHSAKVYLIVRKSILIDRIKQSIRKIMNSK